MKLRQGNMRSSLENVRRFLDDNQAVLGGVINPAARQKLDDSITELSSTAAAQNLFTRDMRGSFAVQRANRVALVRDHMAPIARIAKLELANTPELVKLSLPVKRVSVQQLATLADGMAQAARPYAQLFIDAGRKPDFLDRLVAAADQMRLAAAEGKNGRTRIRKTTTGLTQNLSGVRKVVLMLDAFVKEAAGSDKALLDSWKSAKRVQLTRSARTAATSTTTITAGSTPAAATPATTTTAAAA